MARSDHARFTSRADRAEQRAARTTRRPAPARRVTTRHAIVTAARADQEA